MALVELIIAMPGGTPSARPAVSSALGQSYRPLRVILCGPEAQAPAEPCPEGIELCLVEATGTSLAALYNRAAARARSDAVAFVEPSHELDPHFVERAARALASAPPTVGYVATGRAFSARCRHAPLRLARLALGAGSGALVAAPALFRRASLGPGPIFDERLSPGLEHVELGLRLRSQGKTGLFLPEPLVGRAAEGATEERPSDETLRRDLLRLLRRFPRLGAKALRARPFDAARLWWPASASPAEAVIGGADPKPVGESRGASPAGQNAPTRRSFERGSPTISLLLVNWNSKEDLRACLHSLETQTDRDFETVVVDNGSTDGSLDMLRGEFGWVELVDAGENLGFAEGCNRGIERARGEWIATLNNDAVADGHFVEELRAAARHATERVGMVQARLVFRERPSHTNSTGVVVEPNGVAYDRDFDAPLRAADEPEEIFCPTAGAALYRRAMLEQIRLPSGYFDRTFFMYFEDVDLGWRCRLAGWSALYVPSALAYHAFHGSAGRHGDDFVVRQCRANRMRCMVKNASAVMLVRSTPRTLRWLAGSVSHRGLSAVRDLVDAARSAWLERPLVTGLAVRERRSVERRWLHKPRKENP